MWFLYALLGAIGKSYSGYFRKKIAKNISGDMYMWVSYSLVLLVMTPFMIPQLPDVFQAVITLPIVVFGAVISLMIATQLNLEALKREDLSYTAPLNAFVPVFTLLIASIFLDENPPKLGILGILIVVAGAYIINIKPGRIRWYDPLKRLATSTGAQLSIGVALGYAVNTVLMKVITNEGYNSFVVLYIMMLVGWIFLMHIPITKRAELKAVGKADKFGLLGAAISSFAGNFFHILALANTYSSYAASVRRFDGIFSVLLGWRLLKERGIRTKLIGSLITTLGAIILVLS